MQTTTSTVSDMQHVVRVMECLPFLRARAVESLWLSVVASDLGALHRARDYIDREISRVSAEGNLKL